MKDLDLREATAAIVLITTFWIIIVLYSSRKSHRLAMAFITLPWFLASVVLLGMTCQSKGRPVPIVVQMKQEIKPIPEEVRPRVRSRNKAAFTKLQAEMDERFDEEDDKE